MKITVVTYFLGPSPSVPSDPRIRRFRGRGFRILDPLADEDLRKLYVEVQESRAQLRALSRRLLSVAEDERGRIAREIHDELGQMLSALTLDLGWLSAKLATDAPGYTEKVG